MIIELQTLETNSVSGGMNFFSRIGKILNNCVGKPLESVGKSIKGAIINDGTDSRPPLRDRDAQREHEQWVKDQHNKQQEGLRNPMFQV